MADIDREKFAKDVTRGLEKLGFSYRDAQDRFISITAGMLSKVNSKYRISAENMLTICQHFKLDPFDYLEIEAPNPLGRARVFPEGESVASLLSKLKQSVAVEPSRETPPKRCLGNRKSRSAAVMARAHLRDTDRRRANK